MLNIFFNSTDKWMTCKYKIFNVHSKKIVKHHFTWEMNEFWQQVFMAKPIWISNSTGFFFPEEFLTPAKQIVKNLKFHSIKRK